MSLFTQLKENTALIGHVGTWYTDFDEYLPYSGTISEMFETNVDANIQCDHGYDYSPRKDKNCA